MSVLSTPDCDILSGVDDLSKFQHYVRDLILATDLSLHGICMKNLNERKKQISKEFKNPEKACYLLNDADRISFMCCVMKCADLSNEIR